VSSASHPHMGVGSARFSVEMLFYSHEGGVEPRKVIVPIALLECLFFGNKYEMRQKRHEDVALHAQVAGLTSHHSLGRAVFPGDTG
jgi:hypothetical protein